ncbi:bora [Drosophila busckii]|uniref:Protein aurora borealis n=1 Tax=Drosophila busckii TaxID=30019 RepID=A0A0M4F1Y2_DROBS|nr:bora [Drosophila busckii]
MYTDEVRTPQALKTRYFSELKCRITASGRRMSTSSLTKVASTTPTDGAKPNASPQMCSSATVCTPPPKRQQKVRNPFENALAERLHLPLIASPSLFQCRTRTPQLCSTQFEWDIEEVSQLKPADVEPHETQFHDSPDPEQESKAQLAISTFFKESHIVPSPVDCPLRKQRIILSEIDDNTPISNKTKPRRRDCEVQTELTLPPVLPPALEEALRPYLQPHLAARNCKSGSSVDLFNSSMRRKLFDLQNIVVLGELDQQQQIHMVGSSPQGKQTLFAGRLSDSPGEEGSSSFGCLSPIRNLCGLPIGTPDDGNGKRKHLFQDMQDIPSPIAPSEHLSRRTQQPSTSSNNNNMTLSELTGTARVACKFTPDRSSSPMALEYSTDCSINQRVSRLHVDSIKQLSGQVKQQSEPQLFEPETDYDTDDVDEDAMQLSTLSFNCSSSNSDTPRGHRRGRSANRKNLSQSFSANLLDEPEELLEEVIVTDKPAPSATTDSIQTVQRIGFCRTDSGFNETSSTTSNFACSQECAPLDVSMVCCSTPSTRS